LIIREIPYDSGHESWMSLELAARSPRPMAEIVFSCDCGMILKVYGDDQTGSEITCPSCKAVVTIPSIGQAKVRPPLEPEGDLPSRSQAKAFMIAYLAVTAIATVALIKYLLLPVLDQPVEVARENPRVDQTKVDADPSEKLTTPKLGKKTRPKEINSTKPVEPDKKLPTSPDPDPSTTTTKSPGRSDPPPSPVSPDPLANPITPADTADMAGSRSPPVEAKATANPNSPYAHISNIVARRQLELALEVLKKRNPQAISTAELFLKSAEKESNADPVIKIEVKKLRDRIAGMRGRTR
jgi:ribosomal protein S27E